MEKERVQKQKAALKGPTKKQIKLDEKAAERAVQDHWDKVPLFKVASKSQLESCFLMMTGLLAKAIISGQFDPVEFSKVITEYELTRIAGSNR